MLKTSRLFLWLLPVFFVVHGSNQYFGYLSLLDALWLIGFYILTLAVFTVLFYFLLKSFDKAALLCYTGGSFYLFFGALQDSLKQTSFLHALASYSLLLPILLLFLVFLFLWLRKKTNLSPAFKHYLNWLLVILVMIDLMTITTKAWNQGYFSNSQNQTRTQDTVTYQTSSKPDIYFLLFDEFASPASIFEQTGIRNNLDSFLLKNQFKVLNASRSNYNFTPFSMASLLNMNYLNLVPADGKVSLNEYNQCTRLIENNRIVAYLENKGYEIRNYSIFNIKGYPSHISQSFLPLNTQLLTSQTLGARMRKDLGWIALQTSFGKWLLGADFMKENENNLLLEASVKKASSKQNDRPFFLYAHFMMPHTPYYYNELGQLKGLEEIYAESIKHNVYSYAKYSLYASTRIMEMVKTIQRENPTACIVLLGDHGFRNDAQKNRQFRNLNAIYFPDKDYSSLSDSITNVNEFRLLFNKIFSEQLPLLKDSCIFLQDK